MKWIHVCRCEERLSPRRGFFFETFKGRIKVIHLVLSWRGGKPREFIYDYGSRTRVAVPERWVRLTVSLDGAFHPGWIECAYGIQASPEMENGYEGAN